MDDKVQKAQSQLSTALAATSQLADTCLIGLREGWLSHHDGLKLLFGGKAAEGKAKLDEAGDILLHVAKCMAGIRDATAKTSASLKRVENSGPRFPME